MTGFPLSGGKYNLGKKKNVYVVKFAKSASSFCHICNISFFITSLIEKLSKTFPVNSYPYRSSPSVNRKT